MDLGLVILITRVPGPVIIAAMDPGPVIMVVMDLGLLILSIMDSCQWILVENQVQVHQSSATVQLCDTEHLSLFTFYLYTKY